MRLCHFGAQNDPFVLNKIFWVQTIITFIYLLALFIEQNLENSYSQSRVMRMHHLWAENGPFAPNKFFLENYSYHSHLLMAKILKFFQRIDAQFLGPKWLISPNENFFRKPLNEPCFFHSWLSICQKLKSDINLLVKYWRLKNLIGQETFLANLRKRFFSSM